MLITAGCSGNQENLSADIITSTQVEDGVADKSRKFRLKENEKIPKGIKRIAVGQIDKALDHLQSTGEDADEAIRKARVCTKKIRAVLRLVRSEIGTGVFKEETACFHDAARQLSRVRDTAAMIETLDKLRQKYDDELAPNIFEEQRGRFLQAEKKEQAIKEAAMSEVANILLTVRARVEKWPLRHKGFSAIERGLKLTYKEGRARFEKAFRRPTTRNFHEWRKQVKSLEHQLTLLKTIWPEMVDLLTTEIGKLADHLSDEHDLAMLHRAILKPPNPSCTGDLDSLVTLISRARGEARAQARILGHRIYAEKPQVLVERIKQYWKGKSLAKLLESDAQVDA